MIHSAYLYHHLNGHQHLDNERETLRGKLAGQLRGRSLTLQRELPCFGLKNGAHGAIPARDLPLRSRIYEPFVFNSYEKA